MKFTKGLELNRKYFAQAVRPALEEFDPTLRYSCSLIGYGSDVIGLDDEISMDHNWGPRLQIFLDSNDSAKGEEISDYLANHLPSTFMGFSTNFTQKAFDSTQSMENTEGKNTNHLIEIYEVQSYVRSIFQKGLAELSNRDWLYVPEQILLENTSGEVFYDGLDQLNPFRRVLRYYPDDVRKLKLAAFWQCISNEEAFLGRCVDRSDGIGVKLISARLVSYLMKICFVIKQRYIAYSKWFSLKFRELGLVEIEGKIAALLTENDLSAIEDMTAGLYLEIIGLNNASPDLPYIQNDITTYYSRPYKVIMAEQISHLFMDSIEDDELKDIDLSIAFLDGKVDSVDFTDGDTIRRIMNS